MMTDDEEETEDEDEGDEDDKGKEEDGDIKGLSTSQQLQSYADISKAASREGRICWCHVESVCMPTGKRPPFPTPMKPERAALLAKYLRDFVELADSEKQEWERWFVNGPSFHSETSDDYPRYTKIWSQRLQNVVLLHALVSSISTIRTMCESGPYSTSVQKQRNWAT